MGLAQDVITLQAEMLVAQSDINSLKIDMALTHLVLIRVGEILQDTTQVEDSLFDDIQVLLDIDISTYIYQ